MIGKFVQLLNTVIFVKYRNVLGENMLMFKCYAQG